MSVMLSLVVPVYNGERHIAKCLECLLKQTFRNLEVIIVNDGSTDNTLSILKEYRKRDKRIKIINQYNAGPSAARNTGILHATGEYIGFVDADDWVRDNMYEAMIKLAIEKDVEVVLCNFIQESIRGDLKYNTLPWTSKVTITREEIENVLIPGLLGKPDETSNKETIYGSVCRCIYKRDLIKENNINFPVDTRFTEDLLFNLEVFTYAQQAAVCNEYLYYYTFNPASATKQYMPLMVSSNINSFGHLKRILGEEAFENKYADYIRWRWRMVTINCIINVARPGNTKRFFSKMYEIREIINMYEVRDAFLKYPLSKLSISRKILYFCIKYRISFPILSYYTLATRKEKFS